MSDYEGDWDPVPSHKSQVSVLVSSIPPPPKYNYVVPKGVSLHAAEQAALQKPRRKVLDTKNDLLHNYRPSLQALNTGRNGVRRAAPNAQGPETRVQTRQEIQMRVLQLHIKGRYDGNKESPDGTYSLMHNFNHMAKQLPRHRDLQPLEVAIDDFAKICLSTDAFIAVPEPEEHSVRIWGDPKQVELAKAALYSWEMDLKAPGKVSVLKERLWSKQFAHDGRKEDRLINDNMRAHEREMFLQSAEGSAMAYEVELLWPEGYDLDRFIADYDSGMKGGEDLLTQLSLDFRCKIVHTNKERLRVTKISSDSQQNLLRVYSRLIGLEREMVGRLRLGINETQCRLPSTRGYRERVSLDRKDINGIIIHVPTLTGRTLPQSDDQWSQLCSSANKSYRVAAKTALRSCLKAIHVSQKHVRMRVNFGDVGLTTFERPANGQDFPIDDFITMVRQERIRAMPVPLFTGANFDLPDKCNNLEQLGPPEYCWAVHFLFSGSEGKTLRLERDYIFNPIDPTEPSVSATRWLEINSDRTQDVVDLLVLNQIDLEKVGVQLQVKSETLSSNQKTSEALRSFENNVSFKPSTKGLCFEPAKHTVFPQNQQGLISMREIAVARYTFENTQGTFEVRRIDTFPQKPYASAVPSYTSWTASYYYSEWDTLMSQFSNILPGEDIEWKKDLSTFFPKTIDGDCPRTLPRGFKKFMQEVEGIQGFLSTALGRNTSTDGDNGCLLDE